MLHLKTLPKQIKSIHVQSSFSGIISLKFDQMYDTRTIMCSNRLGSLTSDRLVRFSVHSPLEVRSISQIRRDSTNTRRLSVKYLLKFDPESFREESGSHRLSLWAWSAHSGCNYSAAFNCP